MLGAAGLLLGSLATQAQTIDTVIGAVDGIPVSAFNLTNPDSVVTDSAGNIYITTWRFDHAIRKYNRTSGTVSLFAGTGVATFSGDGGLATAASLNSPARPVMDGQGNLYVADSGNHRVRKVDTQGIITTVAGDTSAGMTALDSPSSLFFDSKGQLYIVNSGSKSVVLLDMATGKTTPYFTGDSSVDYIEDIVFDSKDNLYITDWLKPCVYKIDAVTKAKTNFVGTCGSGTGTLSTSHTNVAPTSIQLGMPRYLAIDAQDNLYLADSNQYTISKIDASTGLLSVIAGKGNASLDYPPWAWPQYDPEFSGDGGPALTARFGVFGGIFYDSNRNELVVVDYTNQRVRVIDAQQKVNTVVGTGQANQSPTPSLPGTQSSLSIPAGIGFDSAGNLLVAESGRGSVRMLAATPATGLVDKANLVSVRASSFTFPVGIAVDAADAVMVGDTRANKIFKVAKGASTVATFAGTGNLGQTGDGAAATAATMRYPAGMVKDKLGNLLFSDTQNHAIRKINNSGVISTVVGKLNTGGFVDGVASDARLIFPDGLALDAAGNLYIADSTNNAIRKVTADANGEITASSMVTTLAGKGSGNFGFSGDNGPVKDALLDTPVGVSVDGLGNIYVVDSGNARVRMISATTGTISTVAGGGNNGTGDGGLAVNAQFMNPQYSALDRQGNLFISDKATGRVRKVTFASPDAPTGTAVAGDAMATISFAPPANMGGGSPTRFVVYYTDSNNTTPVQGCDVAAFDASGKPVTSCDVVGLTNGTPYTFTVTVTNSLAMSSVPSANIGPVTPWPAPSFAAPAAQTAEVGVAYSLSLQALGGSQDFNYTVMGGALPDGLTLAADGTIAGTPTKAGPFSATVQVKDQQTGKTLSGTLTFTVNRGQQMLAIRSNAPASPRLGDTYTVQVNAGPSSQPPELSVSGTCSAAGFVVTFNAAGACTITVSQKGDANYLNAPNQVQTIQVTQLQQSLKILSTAPTSPRIGSTYTVSVQAGPSSKPVTLMASGACSAAGFVVTFNAIGDCTITASQKGDAQYLDASDQVQTVKLTQLQQSLKILSTAPTSPTLGSTYTVSVQAGESSQPVTLVASGACSAAGFVVSFNASGDCTITVSQKGDTQYLDASDQIQTVKVGQGQSGVIVSSTPNPSTPGDAVSIRVSVAFVSTKLSTVAGATKAAPIATGTVTLMDGTSSLGTASLDATGVATLSMQSLTTVGDHYLVANYSGDANYPATQSEAYLHSVVAVPAISPTPVPTMGQWALMLLSAGLLAVATLRRARLNG